MVDSDKGHKLSAVHHAKYTARLHTLAAAEVDDETPSTNSGLGTTLQRQQMALADPVFRRLPIGTCDGLFLLLGATRAIAEDECEQCAE
jgi:hypothetical protein